LTPTPTYTPLLSPTPTQTLPPTSTPFLTPTPELTPVPTPPRAGISPILIVGLGLIILGIILVIIWRVRA
jgi:hypothetical protein